MKNSSLIEQLQSYLELSTAGPPEREPAFHETLKEYLDPTLWETLDEGAISAACRSFPLLGRVAAAKFAVTFTAPSFRPACALLPAILSYLSARR